MSRPQMARPSTRAASNVDRAVALVSAPGLAYFGSQALAFGIRHLDYVGFLFGALFLVLAAIAALFAFGARAE